jgi:PKD repeat protein
VCEFQQVRALAGDGGARGCNTTNVVQLGQVISQFVTVTQNLLQIVFSIEWPGSDLDLVLTSPSGRTIEVSSDEFDVTADEGDTFETITIAHPEPGEWKVDVVGVDVDAEGEPYALSSVEVPLADLPPTAAFNVIRGPDVTGTVQFNGSGSSDDSGIVDYIWDFGDGFADSGETVEHKFFTNGTYSVRLTVVDGTDQSSTVVRTVEVTSIEPPPASPEPTVEPPGEESPQPSITPSMSAASDEKGALPVTGVALIPLIGLGLTLLVAGGILLRMWARRRHIFVSE